MTAEKINIHKLFNGMTLITEMLPEVASGAFVFLLPCGASDDEKGKCGTATVLSEWIFRGAGELDNRQLNDKIEGLGLQRNSHVSSLHTGLSGALVADNLFDIMNLYKDVVRTARLEEKYFQMCQMLTLQGLMSLEDDPRHKIGLLVRERFLPAPIGQPGPGKIDDVQTLTPQDVGNHYRSHYTPHNAILALAGKVDFKEAKARIDEFFGDWEGRIPAEIEPGTCNEGYLHHPHDGAQVHIGIMHPSVTVADTDYYKALAAVNILSGGMGSRLFTEVREKRGLCYAVGANHLMAGPFGAIQCYLGSSPDNAQEALDVTIHELRNLGEGITEDELERAKVGLRATLVMQGESTMARAMGCASDYHHLGRVRSLEEIETAIEKLTVVDVMDYIHSHPAEKFMVVTIGPKELTI